MMTSGVHVAFKKKFLCYWFEFGFLLKSLGAFSSLLVSVLPESLGSIVLFICVSLYIAA